MNASQSDVTRDLERRVIAVPEARQLDVLAGLLEKRGAHVLRCPLVGIKDAPDERPVLEWIERRIATLADLVVFYTGEGVERLVGFAQRAGREAEFVAALGNQRKLTRGPKPKRALRRLGLDAELAAVDPTTQGLVDALHDIELPNRSVAVQLYDAAQDPSLLDALRARGVEPDCVAPYVYASAAEDEQVVALIDKLREGAVDAIAFTSKAQIKRLLKLARERQLDGALRSGLTRTRVAAVGPVVAAELEAAGFRVDAMPETSYSMKPLVTALGNLLGGG